MLFHLVQIAAALSDSTNGLHLRDIELENTVNEVAYKVISLINMTHTHKETCTQIEEFCCFRFLDSRFMFIIVILYIFAFCSFLCSFQVF